ncbi:serine/threonine-protein kinase [Nocardia sp. NPDC059240]|uniref:serine/threonine-protein kinase n=1 Tax=Nocardia sp. NPDC059240 TaxID=3346786 RepID=UPI0036789565
MGDTLRAGEVFAGYRIEGRLGAGGMGEVYLARDRDLPRPVALKLLTDTASRDYALRQRFRREADTVSLLDHPNIVTVFARGEEDGRLWIAMSFVNGTDVAREIHGGPLEVSRARYILAEAGKALDYAHSAGVVHRDVKPANILLATTTPERVVLTDFGIAKSLGETTSVTVKGQLLASFLYAAPERLEESTEVDHRADIYSLGCTLFHMLTGMPPYGGTSIAQVIAGHVHAPIPRAGQRNPALPPAIESVLATAMAKRPEDRYSTCADMAADLTARLRVRRTVVTAAPAPAPTLSPPASDRPDAPAPRHRRWLVGALIAAVTVLVIGSAAYSAHLLHDPGTGSPSASTTATTRTSVDPTIPITTATANCFPLAPCP